MHQAQDTFVAEINGSPVLVQKGSVWASGHAVVKLDGGRGVLFRPLEVDDETPKAAAPRSRSAKAAS